MTLSEMQESLYDLDRVELRRLAWEALLISDGPDRIDVDGDVASSPVKVTYCPDAEYLSTRHFHVSNPQEL